MTPLRILCVDDEKFTLKTMEVVLTKVLPEDSIDFCLHPKEALDRQQQAPFDLVITDMVMPEIDGLELIQRIKEEPCSTEVMVLTSNANVENIVSAMRAGALDYIEKPIQGGILAEKVESLRRKKRTEENYSDRESGLLRMEEEANSTILELQRQLLECQKKMEEAVALIEGEEPIPRDQLLALLNQSLP